MAKQRLVTRSNFDGLVCAILLKELNMIDEIVFVHPKDMQDGKERVDLYAEHVPKATEQIERCATVRNNLVVLDLRKEDEIWACNRQSSPGNNWARNFAVVRNVHRGSGRCLAFPRHLSFQPAPEFSK